MIYFRFPYLLSFAVSLLATTAVAIEKEKTKFELGHHRQKRWDFAKHGILENQEDDQKITTLKSSLDNGKGDIRYSISGEGAGSIFKINPNSGELTAVRRLDREEKSFYHLNVSARNLQGVEVEPSQAITIQVEDLNDNAPYFPSTHLHASIKERAKPGTVVTMVNATDADDPEKPFGRLSYSLVPSNVSNGLNKFLIESWSGVVKTAAYLDREITDKYVLVIQARDAPGSSLYYSCTATLTITVLDVNDSPPRFTHNPYRATVPETTGIGAPVLTVETTDADKLRKNIVTSYSIMDSSHFAIETKNNKGVIKVKQKLDYETATNKQYNFKIKASNSHPESDSNLSILSLEDIADVYISVSDVNEPPEFPKSKFSFSVKENTIVGQPLYKIVATDPEGDSLSYWLDDETGTFFIDQNNGMISLQKKLDRESKDHYQIHVMAGLKNSFSRAEVNIRVEDVNDNPPAPKSNETLELTLCENLGKNQAIFPVITMTDADSSRHGPPFHYKAVNSLEYITNFYLVDNKNDTATIYTRHNSFYVSDRMEYLVQISVGDSGDPPRNATYQLHIRVCYCPVHENPICDASYRAGGSGLSILAALLVISVLLLVIIFVFILLRRHKRHNGEVLIKTSVSSSRNSIQENVFSYAEEGGGEEDTSAFNLDALQRNYCTPISLQLIDGRSDFISPPTDDFCLSKSRRFIPSRDIRDFITNKKLAEDCDDRTLAFDSLQIYGYEGEGSEAGSLSSICSSATDSEQNYDYLKEWGPRFRCLAEMYDSRRPTYED